MEYIKKLKEFTGVTEVQGEKKKENALAEQFKNLAKYFLTEGYFCINGKNVYICDVEFYYHEEFDGGIKDWIMYHRTKEESEKTEAQKKKEERKPELKKVGFFPIGQLNAHTSGVDITFEKEPNEKSGEKGYRAGMLIRGFKIGDPDPKDYDMRSTYFYEALLNNSLPISIEWIQKTRFCDTTTYGSITFEPKFRLNVVKYEKDENGVYVKDADGKFKRAVFNSEDGGDYVTISKIKYKQCMRPWRYKLETVKV